MSEKGGGEQPPRGNLLQRIMERSAEKRKVNFERELFRNGAYSFDFDSHITQASRDLGRKSNWYNEHPYMDAERIAESLARDMDDAKYEMTWRSRFSGLIPKHWDDWGMVLKDFEGAKEARVKLSETLVDAGISHPHHLVANRVGTSQKLTAKQLTWLFVRSDIPPWNQQEILDAQRKMGVSKDDLKKATNMANEARAHAKQHILLK